MPVVRGPVDVVGGLLLRVKLHWSLPQLRAHHSVGRVGPQPIELDALIDTGAQTTCVEPSVVSRLGLPLHGGGFVNMPAAGGLGVAFDYDAGLTIPHPSGIAANELTIHSLLVIATPLNAPGIHALIGRDVLSRCRLVYDGRAGTFALRY